MESFKGIRRAAVAVLLVAFGSSAAHAADGMTCPEYTQPENWRLPLLLLDHEAIAGPPEVAQAAAALHAGEREKAMALLTTAGKIPFEDALRHGKPYLEAVMDAGFHAWLLDGCR